MSIIPNIRATLVERFIFNFRFPAKSLAKRLPKWLSPQIIDGSCVASFCILDLDRVTFGLVPDAIGVRNKNCAHRFGVIDQASGAPAVYVAERNTDSRLGSFITSLGFPGQHSHVDARIDRRSDHVDIRVSSDGSPIFSARVRARPDFDSGIFRSQQVFAEFMASGVRSYCPSKNRDVLNIVDLEKDEPIYTPLSVDEVDDDFLRNWSDSSDELLIDSAARTAGGRYVWTYVGQRSAM